MNIKFEGKFKSITDFEWIDIPKFVIITGPNGTGKSQLLELIHNTITNARNSTERVTIENEIIKGDEVIFLKGEWQLNNTGFVDLSTIQTQINNYYNQFSGNQLRAGRLNPNQIKLYSVFEKIKKDYGKQHDQITKEEFFTKFPEIVIEQEPQLSQKIGEIFYNYRLSEIELQAQGIEEEKIVEKIGVKPWIVLKEIMKESKLPFKFNDPSRKGIRDSFHFKIFNEKTNEEINFNDLSSGEKVLISLVFYLYNSQEKDIFPKLLLLDEPDAHLHPTMAQQFLNVVKNVLVDKYNVRVIMTTHSPSTVVLSPNSCLYDMSRESPRIKKSNSKNHTVSLLTSGLIFVGQGTKYVLVEDEDDVEFYSYLYTTLTNENVVFGDIPLVFIPASSTTKSGGKTVVADWVSKLTSSGLENIIYGLIDEDYGNPVSNGIFKIERYSIENYLIDPIVTYAALMDKEQHFQINGINLKVGEEYKLKLLSETQLQSIADEIFSRLETNIKNYFSGFDETEEKKRIEVKFSNSITLNYPVWLIKRRGKTLLNNLYNHVFTSGTVNFKTLFKALRKIDFIPTDISSLFTEIQDK